MSLQKQQLQQFRQDGVLVAENVVTNADLAPIIAEYEKWIDQRARELQQAGKIGELYEREDFEHRFAKLHERCPEIASEMDIMQLRGPAMFDFLHNENLLDAVECLVGPEITCNPIQHIRAKPPARSEAEKGAGFYNVPWHQDAGVTLQEADNSNIVTCWLALVDATIENGCMEVLPGVWKQGYLEHQAEGGTTIRPDLFPDTAPRPVPVKKGGVVFMHRYTPHRSTPNLTDGVRWSLDLRYQPTGVPTGRPAHPDFVVRSRQNPGSVSMTHAEWSQAWEDVLENSKGLKMHRVK